MLYFFYLWGEYNSIYKFELWGGINIEELIEIYNEHGERTGQQVVDELSPDDIFRLITAIPWGHNQRIIFKCEDLREAVFYVQYTIENNWSRDVLEHQIESSLYERRGKAITNFKDKLPAAASDLAIQTLKDPYSFDF